MLGLGVGIKYSRVWSGIDPQAQTHFNRVIADGGIIPAGLIGLSDYVRFLKIARSLSIIDSTVLTYTHWHYTGLKIAAGTGQTAGNLAVSKIYNLIGATGDLIQTNAANQPLCLVHSGTNYVYLPRVTGNYFSSPYNATITLRSNFDIKAEIQTNLSGAQQDIFSNNATGNLKLTLRTNTSNGLRLILYLDGINALIYDSTVNIGTITNRQWVRVTRNSTSGVIQFFTSSDGTNWIQLGTNVSGATGNLFNGTNAYEIGSSLQGASTNSFQGIIYRVLVSNTIGGTALLDFNPINYNRSLSQSTWTSTTGEVWTNIVSSNNSGLRSIICDTTLISGNGTSFGMSAASLSMNQSAVTSYTIWKKFSNAGSGTVVLTELGANVATGSGKYFGYGFVLNNEEFGINGNVGLNNSRFTSTNLGLKLSTYINNIANANESLPLLTNNVSESFVAQDFSNNNTANMNATGYNLFSRNNASGLWSNALMVGDIAFSGEDDSTKRTAFYNFIKNYINGI